MPNLENGTKSHRRKAFPGIFTVAVLSFAILVLGGAWAIYVVIVKTPADLARNTAQGFREIFNFTPQVRIDQTIVIEQNIPILEVATVSRDLFVEHTWSMTWLGSTKTIQLRGTFTAKAGFDLHEPFHIIIKKNPLRAVAELPSPRMLSLQMNSCKIIKDESGWWNRIAGPDREQALRDLQRLAGAKALESGILDEVRKTSEARIREIVRKNGADTEFVYPRNQLFFQRND